MRKAFKHTGVLMMTALVGLSIIGAAYALWFEDLRLVASVQTGTFNVDWSKHDPAKPVVGIVTPGSNPAVVDWKVGDQIPAGKAPNCSNAVLLSDGPAFGVNANDYADKNYLELSASNLYPFAGCEWEIDIHNSGTVPAHLQLLSIAKECKQPGLNGLPGAHGEAKNPCGDLASVLISVVSGSYANGTNSTKPALDACKELFEATASGATVSGVQLHTNNELVCKIRITLAQDPRAEADNFKLTLVIRSHQWNEDQADPSP